MVRRLWTSLFWPVEETPPPCAPIANLEKLTNPPFASPGRWERFQRWAACSACGLGKTARVSGIQVRRAGFRAQRAFQKRTAWTFATVTGSLGVVLMILLQLMYSFQTLGAKNRPDLNATAEAEELPKTRIDPGFPQSREAQPNASEFIQFDPNAPAQPDPFAVPVQVVPQQEFAPPSIPVETQPLAPRENVPPVEEIVAKPLPQPPGKEAAFVDPLDNLPPFNPGPVEPVPNPPAEFPSVPMNAAPPTKSPHGQFRPFNPARLDPQPGQPMNNPPPESAPAFPIPNPPPKSPNGFVDPLDNLPPTTPRMPQPPPEFPPVPEVPLMENPPPKSPNGFVDPLDNLPPTSPRMPQPPPDFPPVPEVPLMENPPPKSPNGFVDPLDNLPPSNPLPRPSQPVANPPRVSEANSVELGIGIVRLPKDEEERFVLQSGSAFRRQKLSREVRLDAWDRHLEQQRQSPLPPKPYWDRLSLEDRRKLEQDLLSPPSHKHV